MKDPKVTRRMPAPVRRLLDATQPFQRDDVIWALDYVRHKAADKALFSSAAGPPPCCEYFACFAEMALILLNRQMPGPAEQARFRAMLAELYAE